MVGRGKRPPPHLVGPSLIVTMKVKDAYMLNFFETNSSHLPQWCNNDGGNVNCEAPDLSDSREVSNGVT